MASHALENWRSARSARLDALAEMHGAVGGRGRDERWRAEQLNHALVLRLAVEFQGFCRDLHDAAADTFSSWAAPDDARLANIIRASMTKARLLDRGNATRSRLTDDFGRFGMQVSQILSERDPRMRRWFVDLERLNTARNAIAHDNPEVLAQLDADGQALTLTTLRRWRGALAGLAATLDIVTAEHLAETFGREEPW